jgi:radical SAM superfamily enzyme YgiQ (UPF0313 family)
MRLLLINPPSRKSRGSIWTGIRSVMPPLGMAWIAACAERKGHRVDMIDLAAEEATDRQFLARLKALGAPDFAGIGAITETADFSLHLAELCKTAFPAAKVMLGGVHPSTLPEEILASPHVDLVVC